METAPCVYFISTPCVFDTALPWEWAPGYIIRRPKPEELISIKRELSTMGNTMVNAVRAYEFDVVSTIQPGGDTSFSYIQIPEDQWRYYVIEAQDVSRGYQIEDIVYLANPPLEILFSFFTTPIGNSWYRSLKFHSGLSAAYYESYMRFSESPRRISAPQMAILKTLGVICLNRPISKLVGRPLRTLHDSRQLPADSDALCLMYFAIIESILTHKPDGKDTIDSITRQIKGKFKLLSKRFLWPLEYTKYFKPLPAPEKLWSLLYSYRSKIAHGDGADFEGNLAPLKDRNAVLCFLKEAVSLLIVEGIREEEFMIDLRDC